jgi:hypothetical protein
MSAHAPAVAGQRHRWALLGLLPAFTACTTLVVQQGQVTQQQLLPGVQLLRVEPVGPGGSVVSTRGWGLVFGSSAVTLGYLNESALLLPDASSCRVVIVVRNAADLAAIQTQLRSGALSGQVCALNGESSP